MDAFCSSIGSLTNPSRVTNNLASVKHVKVRDYQLMLNAYMTTTEEELQQCNVTLDDIYKAFGKQKHVKY